MYINRLSPSVLSTSFSPSSVFVFVSIFLNFCRTLTACQGMLTSGSEMKRKQHSGGSWTLQILIQSSQVNQWVTRVTSLGPVVSSDRKEESEPDEAKAPSSSGVLEPVHLTKGETHPPATRPSYWVGEDDSGLVRAGVHLRRSWSQPLGEVVLLVSRPC